MLKCSDNYTVYKQSVRFITHAIVFFSLPAVTQRDNAQVSTSTRKTCLLNNNPQWPEVMQKEYPSILSFSIDPAVWERAGLLQQEE